MRYNLKYATFYEHMGEEGKRRRLYYQVVNVDLSPFLLCELSERNRILLEDDSWDRKYRYYPDSTAYVPSLLTMFEDYFSCYMA